MPVRERFKIRLFLLLCRIAFGILAALLPTTGAAPCNARQAAIEACGHQYPFTMPLTLLASSAISETCAKSGANAAMSTPTAFHILVIEDNSDLAKLFADMF